MSHSAPIFKKLNVLNLQNIYVYAVQLFLYKYHHMALPGIFNEFFVRNNTIHRHGTRLHNLFHVPMSRLVLVSRTVRYSGVKIYNHFSACLDFNCSLVTYKRHLKYYLRGNDVSFLLWDVIKCTNYRNVMHYDSCSEYNN